MIVDDITGAGTTQLAFFLLPTVKEKRRRLSLASLFDFILSAS